MKKILLASIALGAMVFASCSKNGGEETVDPTGTVELVVKLDMEEPAEQPATRMITAPGTTGQLKLNDGHIFIINGAGSVVQHVVLDVAAASSATGQVITTPVSSGSRVYILGNIPSSVTPGSINSLTQLQTTVVNIQTSGQTDYTKAFLANQDGTPVPITVTTPSSGSTPGSATVTVSLVPLYSRLELAQVSGGPNIVSFTVTGVYVDRYYSSFTLTGQSSGSVWNQSTKTDFTGNIGDAGSWASTGAQGSAVANPGSGQSWTYHMASDDLPRFIVKVENVVYMNGTQQTTVTDPRYITVTGYSGTAPTKFERGKIYQIATLPFTENNLGMTPNQSNVNLNVKTQVVDWVPTPLTPTVSR
jgi:hypothetical protein